MRKLSEFITHEKLKKALIDGSVDYDNPKKKHSAGIFHGKSGQNRAKNIKKYAENIEADNTIALFALLRVLFESSSSSLKLCVAEQLIKGEYKDVIIFGSSSADNIPPTDTLATEVFSQSLLKASKNVCGVQDSYSAHELGATFFYNKLKGTRYILNSIYNAMQLAQDEHFKSYANFFKNNLTCDPETTKIGDLPEMEMNTKPYSR